MSLVSKTFGRGSAGRVAVVSLDRREAGNALSQELCLDLARALQDLGPPVRAVVLASSARHFCVGADLRERSRLDRDSLLTARRASLALTRALVGCPLPIVAAVHGAALGGGLELILAADVIVADSTAVFGLPEAGIGIVPGAGGTQLLARRVGWGAACDMALTGRRLSTEDALGLRLVDRAVAAGDAVTAAMDVAGTIAGNNPRSTRLIKHAMRAGSGLSTWDALAVEDTAWREAALSDDYREGLASFAERRRPRWQLNVAEGEE